MLQRRAPLPLPLLLPHSPSQNVLYSSSFCNSSGTAPLPLETPSFTHPFKSCPLCFSTHIDRAMRGPFITAFT